MSVNKFKILLLLCWTGLFSSCLYMPDGYFLHNLDYKNKTSQELALIRTDGFYVAEVQGDSLLKGELLVLYNDGSCVMIRNNTKKIKIDLKNGIDDIREILTPHQDIQKHYSDFCFGFYGIAHGVLIANMFPLYKKTSTIAYVFHYKIINKDKMIWTFYMDKKRSKILNGNSLKFIPAKNIPPSSEYLKGTPNEKNILDWIKYNEKRHFIME